jgi:hypothetical protein
MGLAADMAEMRTLYKTFVKTQWKRAAVILKCRWIAMNLQKMGCQDMTWFRLGSSKVK